ncbi:MAG: ATP-binding protein [Paludibacteraceae bacterium]|nr:ATP-binding protein [Paludibacteraceae bacterium]
MIKRTIFQRIASRLDEPRMYIQVLYGPRQVGKTTLVSQYLESSTTPHQFVTADDIIGDDQVWLRQVWSEARLRQQQVGCEYLLAIDEVQKIRNWSEIVKKEWDADTLSGRPLKVVLLGSSSLLLQKGLSESLAGRFEATFIPHWSFAEMRDGFGFSLEDYVYYGGYPGAARLAGDVERWRQMVRLSMIDTTISRDVLALNRVDKPALLKRLFDLGCAFSSQIVALNKIQGELQEKGNLTTLSGYLGLLSESGLLCGLEKFSGNMIHARASKPKLQVFNNALMSAVQLQSKDELLRQPEIWGRWMESAVGSVLLNFAKSTGYELNYWNKDSREVDYVLRYGQRVVAIEVKSGQDSTNEGMAIFNNLYHPDALYTIGTDGIPFEDFFLMDLSQL